MYGSRHGRTSHASGSRGLPLDEQVVRGTLRGREVRRKSHGQGPLTRRSGKVEHEILDRYRWGVRSRPSGPVDLHGFPGEGELREDAAVLEPLRDGIRLLGGDPRDQCSVEVLDGAAERCLVSLTQLAQPLAVEVARVPGPRSAEGFIEPAVGAQAQVVVGHEARYRRSPGAVKATSLLPGCSGGTDVVTVGLPSLALPEAHDGT